MKKQLKVQLTLLFTAFILIVLTYFYYPNLDKPGDLKDQIVQEKLKDNLTDEESTSFDHVKYKGIYDFDKTFIIEAEKAHILNENPDIVYMKSMHVILYLNDGRIVNITSTEGRYNKSTYDCFFENEVKATDGDTEIFAENLNLLASEDSVDIYNNVILNYSTSSLRADKINYNFETKYFKVSMFEDKKIKMKVIK